MAQLNGSSSKNNYGFYAVITESLPSNYINTNKTIINYTIYIKNNNVCFNSSGWTKYVKIDGSNVFNQTNQSINSSSVGYSSALAIISGSTEITHNDNGSKSISFEACIEKSSYTAYDPGKCYLSGSIVLTTIPRASTVVCTNGTIGSAVSININRSSSLFTHTLKYSFGDLTGTIATNVSTNYGWVIPTEFYSQIPNSKTGDVTIFCETYQNENKIGDTKSYKFKVSVDEENCKPIADVTIETIDNNTLLLTQDSSTAIKFISNVKVTTIAEAMEYSTINKIEVLCGDGKNSSGSEALITAVESGDFIIKITDSRGCVTTVEKSISIIDYILMTLNANPTRINPTSGKISFNINGNYFNSSFGANDNQIHLFFRSKEISSITTYDLSGENDEWTELIPEITDNKYSYNIETEDIYDYTKKYQFEFKVYDKLTGSTIIRKVTEGIPSFAIFDKFVEFFGIRGFEKSEDDTKSILNKSIVIGDTNKTLEDVANNMIKIDENKNAHFEGNLYLPANCSIFGEDFEIMRHMGTNTILASNNSVFLRPKGADDDSTQACVQIDGSIVLKGVNPAVYANAFYLLGKNSTIKATMSSNIEIFTMIHNNLSNVYLEIKTSYSLGGVSNAWGINAWASDKRLKNSIKDTKVNALNIIKKMKHRSFKYNGNDELVKIGYVADELQEIDEQMIFEVGENKLKQPKESYIIPILSKAIQEQQEYIEKLEKRIKNLERVSGIQWNEKI